MMGYGAGTWMGLGGWLTLVGWIALVVGLVLLVAWAAGRIGDRGESGAPSLSAPATAPASDAIEVLRLRFARGEITTEEYREARSVLDAAR